MKKKLSLLEIGIPGQYKSPEALARQEQEKDKAVRHYGFLTKRKSEIEREIKELTEELKQLNIKMSAIEKNYMNQQTDLDDFDF